MKIIETSETREGNSRFSGAGPIFINQRGKEIQLFCKKVLVDSLNTLRR